MTIEQLTMEMICFFQGDARRIGHALKVHSYARTIGVMEALPADNLKILEAAALLHDLGIKVAMDRYGSCTVRQQEELGPDAAAVILEKNAAPSPLIDRVRWLIAHHHSPESGEDKDFRILLEADYLVNLEEGSYPLSSAQEIREKHFRTNTGKGIIRSIFGV